jgi:hypothetical protein
MTAWLLLTLDSHDVLLGCWLLRRSLGFGYLWRQLKLLLVLLVDWLKQSLRQLPTQLFNFEFVHAVLTVAFLDLSLQALKFSLKRFHVRVLLLDLLLEPCLLLELLQFSFLQLLL